ncbi:MAG TPA: MBL fold metallo-hydrolase [Vulgatibacter sp.]
MQHYVRQLSLGPMENFIHLFGPAGGREAAVVDPAWDAEAILAAARADGKEIVAAFVTHHHHDHVNALGPLLDALPAMRAFAQGAEIQAAQALRDFGPRLEAVAPGRRVSIGSLEVSCVHTPGHTPGSQCLHAAGSLFTGDTLFVGGCGRCDLAGGDPEAMFDSLHRVLGALPGDTKVYPGHDYGDRPVSSLAHEAATNPYLQRKDLESFVAYRMRPRG